MDFFAELQRLRESRPHPCILTVKSENSDYCPYHGEGKNSYMVVGHMRAWDCLYGFWVGDAKDCVDCAFTEKSEFCYECVDCRDCYSNNYCQDCLNCSFCEFCYDCKGCMNCFGCVNLRNKEYYIFNERCDKETWEQKTKELRKEYYQAAREQNYQSNPGKFYELVRTLPHVYLQGFQNENVIGDHIFHSRNAFYCFDVNEIEDCFYMFNAYTVKDCMDTINTNINSELNYMCMSAVNIFNSNFCSVCWYSRNLEYCEYVYHSHDCFGCVSRSHAEYEILNQKYTKEDYFKKVAEIKEELREEGSYGRWWWPTQYPELQPTPAYMGLQYFK